ncbi:MAG: O-antigen ligase family protein [Anaerolinea sp.]|nr:O-antigen ligase family protein [Anaerolinea sp.]
MKALARGLVAIEPLLLSVSIAVFWFPDPNRVWSLFLFVPIIAARLILYRRLWTALPLNIYLIIFTLLMLVNTYVAPGTWGLYMMGRPILGFLLMLSFVEHAREHGHTRWLVMATLLLALVVGILSLGASQWTNKSTILEPYTSLFPRITFFPGAEGGFNVNEIGGALAYLAPFAAAIAIYDWRTPGKPARRWIATIGFAVIVLSLFLGQSRMAIFGMIGAVGGLIWLLIPRGRWRTVAIIALVAFTTLEVLIVAKVFDPNIVESANRDEASTLGRIEVYRAALQVVIDHPLTGVGLNRFRAVRDQYPVPGWEQRVLPHAHNELLQIATDMGIPGVILYAALYGVLARMLWRAWRDSEGDLWARTVTAAAAAALLAHNFFGLADAITLWDRFGFLMWWFFGVGAAQAALVARLQPDRRAT